MIDLIVALVVLGLILWVVDQLPIDAVIKRVIHVVAIVIAVLWALQLFGLWHGFPNFRR